ncbi:P-loop containing nucleoside triphosphate hydrolase protein, partial [Ascodesmis nigricans]
MRPLATVPGRWRCACAFLPRSPLQPRSRALLHSSTLLLSSPGTPRDVLAPSALSTIPHGPKAPEAPRPEPFIPRLEFPHHNLPTSYFLGHHRAALTGIQHLLSSVDLIVECRDFRVPLSSRNPLFEEAIAGKRRIIVYTKKDLGDQDDKTKEVIRSWHLPTEQPIFLRNGSISDFRRLLNRIHEIAREHDILTGTRMLILGMPNVGKSTLLNELRHYSLKEETKMAAQRFSSTARKQMFANIKREHKVEIPEGPIDEFLQWKEPPKPFTKKSTDRAQKKLLKKKLEKEAAAAKAADQPVPSKPITKKVAKTGAQPGVTRSISSLIVISRNPLAYVYDTPGIFIPHLPDPNTMLKLSLAGCVKDGLVPLVTVADYLLFRINLRGPEGWKSYSKWCPEPTNDVHTWLRLIARKIGRFGKLKAEEYVQEKAATEALKEKKKAMKKMVKKEKFYGQDGMQEDLEDDGFEYAKKEEEFGQEDLEATAMWAINRYREGGWGSWSLDEIVKGGLDKDKLFREGWGESLTQTRLRIKRERKEKAAPSES